MVSNNRESHLAAEGWRIVIVRVTDDRKDSIGPSVEETIALNTAELQDAARIFDRLDIDILLKVAKQMNPRKMADIMGRMSPEASERLTVALVNGRGNGEVATAPASDELPKIMGN